MPSTIEAVLFYLVLTAGLAWGAARWRRDNRLVFVLLVGLAFLCALGGLNALRDAIR
jgi:hypothetical protein